MSQQFGGFGSLPIKNVVVQVVVEGDLWTNGQTENLSTGVVWTRCFLPDWAEKKMGTILYGRKND